MDDANAGPEEAAPGKVGEIANIVGRPVASYELACVTGHNFVGCLDNAGRGVLAVLKRPHQVLIGRVRRQTVIKAFRADDEIGQKLSGCFGVWEPLAERANGR
jgi:hypothetical protein